MAASNTQPASNAQPTPNRVTSFIKKYPRTTGIIGNIAFGAAQNALERKFGLNDGYIDRYYEHSSGHPILGEIGSEIGLELLNPAVSAGLIGTSALGTGLKYINKKAGGIELWGDGDLGQYGELLEHPGRGLKFALDNTVGRLFHGGKLAGRGYTSDDDADVKFGDSARLEEINENGGLNDYYTIITNKYPELKAYFKPIDSNKYLGLTMDQLRYQAGGPNNELNPVSLIDYNIMTDNGHYHVRDMQRFMTKSMGLDPSLLGISGLLNGNVGMDLTPEFYKEFVLSDYYKGDKNAELKRLGFDPQKVYAEQHAKGVDTTAKYMKDTEQGIKQGKWVSGNTNDPITSKYMSDWAAKKQAIEQGKWIPGKSDIQNGQLVNGDDSPTILKHEKNTVESSQQPNVHKNNATDSYLQYLMYRDYQKDKQRAESQKDMGLIPLLLAAYGMANIVR